MGNALKINSEFRKKCKQAMFASKTKSRSWSRNNIFHFYLPVKFFKKRRKKTYHSKKCHYRTQDLQELLPTLFWGRFSLTDLHPVSCWPWWFFPSKRTKFKTCGASSVFRCLLPSRNQSAFRRLKIWSSSKFSLGNTMYVLCALLYSWTPEVI